MNDGRRGLQVRIPIFSHVVEIGIACQSSEVPAKNSSNPQITTAGCSDFLKKIQDKIYTFVLGNYTIHITGERRHTENGPMYDEGYTGDELDKKLCALNLSYRLHDFWHRLKSLDILPESQVDEDLILSSRYKDAEIHDDSDLKLKLRYQANFAITLQRHTCADSVYYFLHQDFYAYYLDARPPPCSTWHDRYIEPLKSLTLLKTYRHIYVAYLPLLYKSST